MSSFDNKLINTYKTMFGLTNVDNTSDLNKPISNATQTALNSKLNTTGGILTGDLTGTTANFSGDVTANGISISSLNSGKLNLTGGTLVGGLTGTTASFSGDVTANGISISSLNSGKLNLTGGTLTGTITVPQITDLTLNNNTVATTSFVKSTSSSIVKNPVNLCSTSNITISKLPILRWLSTKTVNRTNGYYDYVYGTNLIPSTFVTDSNGQTGIITNYGQFITFGIHFNIAGSTFFSSTNYLIATITLGLNGSNNNSGGDLQILSWNGTSFAIKDSSNLIFTSDSNRYNTEIYGTDVYILLKISNLIMTISVYTKSGSVYTKKYTTDTVDLSGNIANSIFANGTTQTSLTNLRITCNYFGDIGPAALANYDTTIENLFGSSSDPDIQIDGSSVSNNMRVLLTGQTNQIENGIWSMIPTANGSQLVRPSDFTTGYNASGTIVSISGTGLTNNNKLFFCKSLFGSDIVGTNNLLWENITTQTLSDNKLNTTGGILTGDLTGTTANFSGDITANGISISSLNSGKLNLTGGTLVGGLTGTTASFSGDVTANGISISSLNSGKLNLTGGTLVGGLTGTTASFSADLTVLGRIFCNLPNYVDNTTAKNAGMPIGALYRTGGLIKIIIDDIAPTLTLIGNSNLVTSSLTYTDPGVTATDNYDTSVSVYLTSFLFNSTNIISSPVLINGTNTVITTTTPLQFGNTYSLTYTATDSTGNVTTISRNLSVETPTVTTTYLYTSTNIRATTGRTNSITYSNNNLAITCYSAWAPLVTQLNNISFNIDNQWIFIFKVLQYPYGQRYRIYFDPLFTYSGAGGGAWGNNSLGYYGELDDSLAGGFYAYSSTTSLVSNNSTYDVTNIPNGLTDLPFDNTTGYMIYIKYDSSKYLTIEMWSGNLATRYYTAKRKQPYTFVNKLAPFVFYTNTQVNDLITYQKGILFSNVDVPLSTWNTYFP
jgi:hypothetical protein